MSDCMQIMKVVKEIKNILIPMRMRKAIDLQWDQRHEAAGPTRG